MRARRKKTKRFKDMVPETSFKMPRWKSSRKRRGLGVGDGLVSMMRGGVLRMGAGVGVFVGVTVRVGVIDGVTVGVGETGIGSRATLQLAAVH